MDFIFSIIECIGTRGGTYSSSCERYSWLLIKPVCLAFHHILDSCIGINFSFRKVEEI